MKYLVDPVGKFNALKGQAVRAGSANGSVFSACPRRLASLVFKKDGFQSNQSLQARIQEATRWLINATNTATTR